jgi:hypothetical protein
MSSDDFAQPGGEIIETFVPADRHQLTVLAHQRLSDCIGVVVRAAEGATFRAHVALTQMVRIAPYLDDLILFNVDDDTALIRADPAVATLRYGRWVRHNSLARESSVLSMFHPATGEPGQDRFGSFISGSDEYYLLLTGSSQPFH